MSKKYWFYCQKSKDKITKQKGLTSAEFIIIIAIIGVLLSLVIGDGFQSDAERHEKCVAGATHIIKEDRMSYCIEKIKEEDRNTAIMYSGY